MSSIRTYKERIYKDNRKKGRIKNEFRRTKSGQNQEFAKQVDPNESIPVVKGLRIILKKSG